MCATIQCEIDTNNWPQEKDLKGLDVEKINALTSYDARKVYEKEWATFDDLKDLDAEEINNQINTAIINTAIINNSKADVVNEINSTSPHRQKPTEDHPTGGSAESEPRPLNQTPTSSNASSNIYKPIIIGLAAVCALYFIYCKKDQILELIEGHSR
jgi:hypothetical protein